MERIEGIVKAKKFHNEESGYQVVVVLLPDGKKVHVTGKNPTAIKINDCINVEGSYYMNKMGRQFGANIIDIVLPTKLETIKSYLTSGIIKGLTKKNGAILVDQWGEEAINILDNHPDRLLKLDGIGASKLQKILDSWKKVRPSEQNMHEIIDLGFSEVEAIKIVQKFNTKAMEVIQNRIYTIHKRISYIEFEKVDEIALLMGHKKNASNRILAAIDHFLLTAHDNGECLINYDMFFNRLARYLKVEDRELVNEINFGLQNSFFYMYKEADISYIQHKKIKHAEMEVSRRLFMLLNNTNHKPNSKTVFQIKNIKRDGEKEVSLSEEQTKAVFKSINAKVSVITGGPGTGKTTVLNEVLKQLTELNKSVFLCAPTGKAAQRMKESTGFEASTIHRLLDFNPREMRFRINESNPLKTDVIVIDESSMIDIYLMMNLLRAIDNNTQIVIVGDINQLASVSAGAVLRDIINSGVAEVSSLTQIFRQAAESKIITNAHNINKGDFDFNHNPTQDEDFYFIDSDSDEKTLNIMNTIISKRVKQKYNLDPKNDLQLLVPQHKGLLGTVNLNKEMQSMLNKNTFDDSNGFDFKVGDKVIQTVNNYDKGVFNGDCGIVRIINNAGILVDFETLDEPVEYTKLEIDELNLSYCLSIHKSQGSEYPIAILPLPQEHNGLIDRSLIYTGITRGKTLVVVIGNKKTMKKGIESQQSRFRKTNLKECIVNLFEENKHLINI